MFPLAIAKCLGDSRFVDAVCRVGQKVSLLIFALFLSTASQFS